MKFKVGDRVKYVGDALSKATGEIGTIKCFYDTPYIGVEFDNFVYGHNINGHGKEGYCWWCLQNQVEKVDATKIDIHVHDNVTVADLYKEGKKVKTAVAKCHPDDEFDLAVGAKLAVERLFQKPSKFKVGDKVIGNDLATELYVFTTKGWIGTVTQVINYDLIQVKRGDDDIPWEVTPDAFDLYTEPKYFTGDVVCVKTSAKQLTVGKIYHFKDGNSKADNGAILLSKPATSVDDINARFDDIAFIELVKE